MIDFVLVLFLFFNAIECFEGKSMSSIPSKIIFLRKYFTLDFDNFIKCKTVAFSV